MDVSSSRASNKANIFLGLIEYELNSLLGASHLVDYISVHIRFDLERYLLNITYFVIFQRNSNNFSLNRVKPLQYISWLLGHECKGSVQSLLIKR